MINYHKGAYSLQAEESSLTGLENTVIEFAVIVNLDHFFSFLNQPLILFRISDVIGNPWTLQLLNII